MSETQHVPSWKVDEYEEFNTDFQGGETILTYKIRDTLGGKNTEFLSQR